MYTCTSTTYTHIHIQLPMGIYIQHVHIYIYNVCTYTYKKYTHIHLQLPMGIYMYNMYTYTYKTYAHIHIHVYICIWCICNCPWASENRPNKTDDKIDDKMFRLDWWQDVQIRSEYYMYMWSFKYVYMCIHNAKIVVYITNGQNVITNGPPRIDRTWVMTRY